MKLTLVSSAVMAIALSAQMATAQEKLTANVPFEFQAGDNRMPAGEYSIIRSHNNILVLQHTSTRKNLIQTVNPESTVNVQEKGKLVFNRHGEAYFLSQVWAPGTVNGCSLRSGKREAEMKRASNERKTVVVVAKR
jgi:hypothetical protein